ncbi:MAG: protein arginine kinase [Verrucomicrobiales bacterium]|jgi:protein arginine kinase|nr:protein arginine kinase [Verrucomicrobiales bacterium]
MSEPSAKALTLEQSPGRGIVMSSRVRLARNLKGHPFPGWLKKKQREDLLGILQPAINHLPEAQAPFLSRVMDTFSPLEKQMLVEEHLISREHAAKNSGSGLVVSADKMLSVMINEEDHLRLQAIYPEFRLEEAWRAIDRIDSELEDELDFAFSPTLGYLTACPTNIGTGMRASVMLHLPGLVLSDQINQVIKSVNQIGLAVRGLYGEGTDALGNLFQVSNQITLGESERDILNRLLKVIQHLIEHEHNARQKIVQDKHRIVADQLGRAYGIISHAYSISSKEALNLLSLLILGVDLGFWPASLRTKIDDLFIHTQPAHLQKAAARKLGAEERDAVRADLLRDKLKSIPAPNTKRLRGI